MDRLFEQVLLGSMEIKNRFIRAATWESMAAENGEATDSLIDLYKRLARGEIGLIITGFAYVNKRGKAVPNMLGIDDDALIPSLKMITNAIHQEGSKVAVQLAHGGSQSWFDTGMPTEAPSAVKERATGKVPVEMTLDDIKRIIEEFAESGRRAKEASFDGIELHAAHGFLLSQFLSPYSNRRTDGYGGPIEKRARIIFEIYEAIRQKVGNEYPIIIKLNVSDFDGQGLEPNDSLWVCKQLSEMGIDAIELSGGTFASGQLLPIRGEIDSPAKEGYFKREVSEFKNHLKCPVILVGGLRTIEIIEEMYKEGNAEFFSLSRSLISEPDLIKRWQLGNRRRARCISCNKCLTAAFEEGKLYCVTF